MAFTAAQFNTYIPAAIAHWANPTYHGLGNPTLPNPDTNAVKLFDSYSATPGLANLSVTWATQNWMHCPNHGIQLYRGNNAAQVVWHDQWNDASAGPTGGKSVVISRRHVLCTEHGNDPPNYWQGLQIPKRDSTVITRFPCGNDPTVNGARRFVASSPNCMNFAYGQGWRVIMVSEDMPDDLITPIIDPADMCPLGDLIGKYVVSTNHWNEITSLEIVSASEQSGLCERFRLKAPTNTDLAKVCRPFGFDNPNLPPTGYAGSGSPIFMVFTNSYGQSRFVYFGHATNIDSTPPQSPWICYGPPYFWTGSYEGYAKIKEACQNLNVSNGFSQNAYLPEKLTDAYWPSTLQSGLVSYWKLDESSGNRADSHGSNSLSVQYAPVGQGSGKVYTYAANFDTGGYLKTGNLPIPSGSVTISAWCYVGSSAQV